MISLVASTAANRCDECGENTFCWYVAVNVPCGGLLLRLPCCGCRLWPRNSFIKKPGIITVEFLPPIPPGLPREEMMTRLQNELEAATDKLIAQGFASERDMGKGNKS